MISKQIKKYRYFFTSFNLNLNLNLIIAINRAKTLKIIFKNLIFRFLQ